MSLEPGPGFRTASPAGSGRDSPILRVPRQRELEEGINPRDKAFRRYASGVDRALASFDTAQQDWADYISFLGRLLKALQAHPPDIRLIPDNYTVATRLAQCLNPTLPSGVHQKALEVYGYVFSTIGKSNLARDIHLYLPGLAPVLSFASLTVRPNVLSLLDAHILPLGASLRPPLKSIILCLLPGLEDEGSEDFEQVLQLLNKFRVAVRNHAQTEGDDTSDASQDSFFWPCFFLCTITNSSWRQGALAFLTRELPKFGNTGSTGTTDGGQTGHTLGSLAPNARAALSPEPGLLIRCLAAGLSDSQLLVQRGFLDLLVTHLPLNSVVLQHSVPESDLERLVYAAVGVVSRRDMGLNRRLWTWLLGPDSKTEHEAEVHSPIDMQSPGSDKTSHHAAYFAKYGLRALTRSLMMLFNTKSAAALDHAKPFRLCLSLMDRWEVGGLLIPDIFIPALRSALVFSKSAEKPDTDEVIKSASNFFDGVESGLIWAKFNQLGAQSFKPNSQPMESKLQDLDLCSFVMSRFNIREEEMIAQHIPRSALYLIVLVRTHTKQPKARDESSELQSHALEIIEKLIALIPDRAFSGMQKASDITKVRSTSVHVDSQEILKRINRFYDEQHGGLDGSSPPFPPVLLGSLLLRESIKLFMDFLSKPATPQAIEPLTRFMCNLLHKIPNAGEILQQEETFDSLLSCLTTPSDVAGTSKTPFRVVGSVTAVLVASEVLSDRKMYFDAAQITSLQRVLIEKLWQHLTPYSPKHHVEAVRCLWQLEGMSPAQRYVEASITLYMAKGLSPTSKKESISQTDAARRFAVLWTHSTQEKSPPGEKGPKGILRRTSSTIGLGQHTIPSDPSSVLTRPLLLLLDALDEEGTELFAFTKTWLQELPTLSKVFAILCEGIRSLACIGGPGQRSKSGQAKGSEHHDDSQQCLYYMRHLLKILKLASEHTWVTVAGDVAESLHATKEGRPEVTVQVLLIQFSMKALDILPTGVDSALSHVFDLHRVALTLAQTVIQAPYSQPLKDLELQNPLLERLLSDLDSMDSLLQSTLLETITAVLKLSLTYHPPRPLASPGHARKGSKDILASGGRLSITREQDGLLPARIQPPPLLIECLNAGFSSRSTHVVVDSWVTFLIEVLPLFADTVFQNLIPLVECFCSQIGLVFSQLRSVYLQGPIGEQVFPEPTLIGLMNGLEHVLASAHERLLNDEGKTTNPRSPDQPQSFFGNMVQGVFTTDSQQPTRSSVANNRLTVMLSFQDTVRTCFTIWSWGIYEGGSEKQEASSLASYGYTALRMRNRARRLLEHLFAAESLECLETLAALWCRPPITDFKLQSVMGLLNVLNGSRPKHTVPAIFNAIYSRTNPNALDPAKISSMTSELKDTDLIAFLVEYMRTIEDDAMDEIWNDCMTFLKDVLSNPLPHSHILPTLLEFTALLAEKVDNTNFGEQRRMRRELGDLFLRLLTATFTTRPMGFLQEPSQSVGVKALNQSNGQRPPRIADVVSVLASIIPRLKLILVENDRIGNAVNSITANVTGPTLRAKSFPSNIDRNFLNVLHQLTKVSQAARYWKKDVSDALNDARFFTMPLELVKARWMSILYEFVQNDKDRMPELLSRLSAPTTAGIVFGVGATSARMEADRKASLNLRRIAILILSSPTDTFSQNTRALHEKLVELLLATPTSSPSSASRADVFMLLRALVLKTSLVHLAPFWPTLNSELQAAISSILPGSDGYEKYSNTSVLQACKLLDTLIALDPDDFQLHEWLFITDSIDAVYRPANWAPVALVDNMAENLGTANLDSASLPSASQNLASSNSASSGSRRPILDALLTAAELDGADLRAMRKEDLGGRVLRSFFGQLSLLAFEATYGMLEADWQGCVNGLVRDLFEDDEGL